MAADRDWTQPIKRGPLKGRIFASQAEYDEARAQVPDAPEGDSAPGETVPTGRRGRPRAGKVSKEMVIAILFPLNVGLYMVPITRADALNDEEIDRLGEAIVRVAAVNRYVERAIVSAAESGAYVELAMVVGAIAIKRAANHGYLPRQFGEGVGTMLGIGGLPPEPAEPTSNGAVSEPLGVPLA